MNINALQVEAVYGFGSFFRSEPYSDIDLVVVVSQSISESLPGYYDVKSEFDRLAKRVGVTFDLTVLTQKEFLQRPLRDMHQLILLHCDAGHPKLRLIIKALSFPPHTPLSS